MPSGLAAQWNLRQIHAPEAWQLGAGRAETVVAIVDSGIDADHPELAGAVLPGRNVRDGNADTSDQIGHGTEVAGIVAAKGNNDLGVAGLAHGVHLLPVKITSPAGGAASATAAEAIRWATDQGARIVNLSFGTLRDTPALRQAVQYARQRGVLLIAASGNCGDAATHRAQGCERANQVHYPAALPEVVAVGALDAAGAIAPYSNSGAHVRLTAPGGAGGAQRGLPDYLLSTVPLRNAGPGAPLGYAYEFGTSMAAPHVTGAAALVWSVNPALTADEVEAILFETADDRGPAGRDDHYGYGQVNVARAVERALAKASAAPRSPR